MQENMGRKYVHKMCNASWILLGWLGSGVLGESKTGKCKKMRDENMLMKRVTQAGFYLGVKLDDREVEFWVRVNQANTRKWGTKIS